MSDEVKAGFENCFTYTESGYEKDETLTQRTLPPAQRTASSWLTCAAWITTTPSGMTCWTR